MAAKDFATAGKLLQRKRGNTAYYLKITMRVCRPKHIICGRKSFSALVYVYLYVHRDDECNLTVSLKVPTTEILAEKLLQQTGIMI